MNSRAIGTLLTALIITFLAIASLSVAIPLSRLQIEQAIETSELLDARTQQIRVFVYNGTEDGYPLSGTGFLWIAITNYGLSKATLDSLVINNELIRTCIGLDKGRTIIFSPSVIWDKLPNNLPDFKKFVTSMRVHSTDGGVYVLEYASPDAYAIYGSHRIDGPISSLRSKGIGAHRPGANWIWIPAHSDLELVWELKNFERQPVHDYEGVSTGLVPSYGWSRSERLVKTGESSEPTYGYLVIAVWRWKHADAALDKVDGESVVGKRIFVVEQARVEGITGYQTFPVFSNSPTFSWSAREHGSALEMRRVIVDYAEVPVFGLAEKKTLVSGHFEAINTGVDWLGESSDDGGVLGC